MSCADDLTLDDLNESSSTAVLERVTAGEGSNQNLWGQIDRDNVIGVNLLEADSGPRVIKPWDDRLTESGIESGVDDELILHVPFTHSLRLRSFLFFSPSPTHPNRPGRLRLYANFANCPDFADLESIAPLMDVDISSPPVNRAGILSRGIDGRRDVEEWGLKVQKLASVHSVTLFFSEAVSGQRSSVWYVGFKGDPKNNNVDMSKLGTVPAHNAADKKVDQVAEKKGAGYTTIR